MIHAQYTIRSVNINGRYDSCPRSLFKAHSLTNNSNVRSTVPHGPTKLDKIKNLHAQIEIGFPRATTLELAYSKKAPV